MQAILQPRRLRSSPPHETQSHSTRRQVALSARFLFSSLISAPFWMRITLAVAAIALLGTIGLSVVQAQGRVVKGLVIGGTPIGGMSYPDARRNLEAQAESFDVQTVTLVFGDTRWEVSLAELGIRADVETAWLQITSWDSGTRVIDRVARTLHLRQSPIDLEMPLLIDPPVLQIYCAEKMKELGLAPVDAELQINGQSLVVSEDASGFVISVDQFRADLIRELSGFTTPTINLTAAFTKASVNAASLQPELDAITTSLAQPLILFTAADQWEVDPAQLAQHFTVDSSTSNPKIIMDEEAITALADQVSNQIDRPIIEGGLDESGNFARIIQPADGLMVNRAVLKQQIRDAITAGHHEIEIPVVVLPVGTNAAELLSEYGVTDLLASGDSDFSGSDGGRDINVRRAAELIDGTLVAPGEDFSFNRALGGITEEVGFVQAGATEGGIPGTAVGGGVCQVSTSIFRAALLAGLPITEWWPHAYRSTFYEQGGWPPGFDASIQQEDTDTLEGADFKFTNTTDGWLLISVTVTANSNLVVELFGTSPDYDVVISDPIYEGIISADETPIEEVDPTLAEGSSDLWQPARDGVTMIIHRTVYASDGSILIDEDFISTYQPQGPVYRVSSDMEGSTAAGW